LLLPHFLQLTSLLQSASLLTAVVVTPMVVATVAVCAQGSDARVRPELIGMGLKSMPTSTRTRTKIAKQPRLTSKIANDDVGASWTSHHVMQGDNKQYGYFRSVQWQLPTDWS